MRQTKSTLFALTTLALALAASGCQQPASGSTATAQSAPAQASAQQGAPLTLDAAALDTSASHTATNGFLGLGVPFAPINALESVLETRQGLSLKDRGEAHITVLTPPELSALASKVSLDDILDLDSVKAMQDSSYEPVCVGRGVKGSGARAKQTFFVVVKAPALFAIRREVAALFIARGGRPNRFDAEAFTPHVTIGFTHTDLFEQDGVVKDESSCIAPIELEQ